MAGYLWTDARPLASAYLGGVLAGGVVLLLVGVALLALSQKSRNWDRRPLNRRLAPDDPVWGLPVSGRVIAAAGMLVGALGAVLIGRGR